MTINLNSSQAGVCTKPSLFLYLPDSQYLVGLVRLRNANDKLYVQDLDNGTLGDMVAVQKLEGSGGWLSLSPLEVQGPPKPVQVTVPIAMARNGRLTVSRAVALRRQTQNTLPVRPFQGVSTKLTDPLIQIDLVTSTMIYPVKVHKTSTVLATDDGVVATEIIMLTKQEVQDLALAGGTVSAHASLEEVGKLWAYLMGPSWK